MQRIVINKILQEVRAGVVRLRLLHFQSANNMLQQCPLPPPVLDRYYTLRICT